MQVQEAPQTQQQQEQQRPYVGHLWYRLPQRPHRCRRVRRLVRRPHSVPLPWLLPRLLEPRQVQVLGWVVGWVCSGLLMSWCLHPYGCCGMMM